MKPSNSPPGPSVAALFVRSVGDLPGALLGANELLSWRASMGLPVDEVLAILLGEPVGAGCAAPGRGAGFAVTLRESVGPSGVWELGLFGIECSSCHSSPSERRRMLLEHLLCIDEAASPSRSLALLPVWTSIESRGRLDAHLDDLRASFSAVAIGRSTFLHTPSRGIVRVAAARDTRALQAYWPS